MARVADPSRQLTLIRDGAVFSPRDLGKKDILILDGNDEHTDMFNKGHRMIVGGEVVANSTFSQSSQ
jgi:hypothetical protein